VAAVIQPKANYLGRETGGEQSDLTQFVSAAIKYRWAAEMLKVREGAAA
jgi:hypothetical protein